MTKSDKPFRCFNSSPEVIRLVVMMYVRFPLSLRNVEDLLFERGIDICHETVRFWWNRERAMLRFRRTATLQKFVSVNASFHNHFNQERNLVDRQTYKLRRSAALAEWQSLAA
jgi:transposase-like protein